MGVYVCVQAVIIDRDICSGIIYHELGYTFSDVYLEGQGNLAFRFKSDFDFLFSWELRCLDFIHHGIAHYCNFFER